MLSESCIVSNQTPVNLRDERLATVGGVPVCRADRDREEKSPALDLGSKKAPRRVIPGEDQSERAHSG